MTPSAELHGGGIHDDVAEGHADHVVVVDGADADAVQIGQRHHQLLPTHGAPVGVLPFVLQRVVLIGGNVSKFARAHF